jgi:L-serine dehydratase
MIMNVFDIIGPVMIGPSSSHTAGAVRLGQVARKILGERAVKADICLSGSFAQTYRGHGTDKALIAGIMGMYSDDGRIRHSLEIARAEGLAFTFSEKDIPGAHPNTARIHLVGESGSTCSIQGASIGGGNILIHEINGMSVSFTGQYNTLVILHYDKPGTIAAVTNFMAYSGTNIGNFRLSRPVKGGEAVMTIEVDGNVSDELIRSLGILPNVIQVVLIRAISGGHTHADI